MASLICAHALSILLVGGLRFGPAAVLPGAGELLWRASVGAAAVALLVSLVLETRRGLAPWRSRGRLLLWLVFPVAAGISWGLGGTTLPGGADAPLLGLIFGLVATVLVLRYRAWALRETRAGAWRTGAAWLVLPTAGAVVAIVLHDKSMSPGTVIALVTYPVYAAAQLCASLVLPWTQWERDGVRPGLRVVAACVLFALVHWPNPFAVIATGAGMTLWALAWRAGSAFIPLALSMGILATFVTQGLPDSTTHHMRVGSNYVIRSWEVWLDGEAWRLNQAGRWDDTEGLRPWLQRALTEFEGEPVDPTLVAGVAATLEQLHREDSLRWIFDSGEFRRRHGFRDAFSEDEMDFFESTFVPYHPGHAGYVEVVAAGAPLTTGEFIRLAYQTFLGREPLETEYQHWPEPVTAGKRWLFLRRVVEVGGLRAWNEPGHAREKLRAYRAARRE